MERRFEEITSNPIAFFDILPADWREGIEPHWHSYKDTARIFALSENGQLLGGGIVFSTVSPDTEAYREEAQAWLDKGLLYIAFFFFLEKYRGQKLGSLWLEKLFARFPGQPFWLTIDDHSLAGFYQKNGFTVVKELEGSYGKEWLLAHGLDGDQRWPT